MHSGVLAVGDGLSVREGMGRWGLGLIDRWMNEGRKRIGGD